MRVPLSWLQELTPLPATPADRAAVVELASELDALGLVVEGTEWVGEGLHDVVLARVLEIGRIEGADRIRHVVVETGDGETTEVVCGAWNFEVGDVVPLAPVGATLPGGVRIERRKMKGAVSNGMLCSGRELGLSDDHAGILVLSGAEAGAELGSPLDEALGIGRDVVFDLAIEPNRPDCLSMVGIARDVAARYGLPLQVPEPSLEEADPPTFQLASVAIEAPELCRRFLGRVLSGVRLVASPPMVQRRLVLAGMRPINHVVDASNYVMLELGQPSHPYDLDQLGGAALRVRAAHPGEAVVTLDGETRILGGRPPRGDDPTSALDAVICSGSDVPVGIAGVMGGRSGEIEEATTRVLLEVAHFDATAVGRTARHVGLRTEASVRFERGVDSEGLDRAAARVCELVVAAAEAAGIEPPAVAAGAAQAEAAPLERSRIRFRPERANALLGLDLTSEQMVALLAPIGYEAATASGALELVVPSWRPDVTEEVDVTEDVARTYGYRRIPLSDRRSPFVGHRSPLQVLRRRTRTLLAGLGAHEAWTPSIVDPAEQEMAGIDIDLIRLVNPMVAEESVLRGGLMPGLLTALRHNAGHRNGSIRLFEMGDVFALGLAEEKEGAFFADERERCALVLARDGDDAVQAMRAWHVIAEALGVVGIEVLQPLFVPDGEPERKRGLELTLSGLHPARSGLLATGREDEPTGDEDLPRLVGAVGEVDPFVLRAFGLPHERVGWIELDLSELLAATSGRGDIGEVSRYPSSDLDLAVAVSEEVPASAVERVLREAAGEICESLVLFDVYRGPGLEPGERSLAYRLRLCASDRTLTDSDIAEVRRRCVEAVEAALPARLRA